MRNLRWGPMWVAVHACLFMAFCRPAKSDCNLPLRIDGEASTFEFSGTGGLGATTVDVVPAFEDQVLGLLGVLQLVSEEECPVEAGEVDGFLETARLVTRAGEALKLYPSTIITEVRVQGIPQALAQANFTNLIVTWDSSNLRRSADTGPGGFSADVNLTLIDGTVSFAVGSGTPSEAAIANYSTVQNVTGALSVRNSTMGLQVAESEFIFDIETDTPVGAVAIVLNLLGSIRGEVGVGCADDCGPNGWCAELGNDREIGCECKCGWGGDTCLVPTGFCPSENTPALTTTARTVVAEQAALTEDDTGAGEDGDRDSAASGGDQVANGDSGAGGVDQASCSNVTNITEARELFTALLQGVNTSVRSQELNELCAVKADCGDSRSVFDTQLGQCTCAEGWSGTDCNMCETNDACNDFWDTVGGSCTTRFEYDTLTTHKAYSCDFTDFSAGLQTAGFGLGNELRITCNTTGPNLASRLGAGGLEGLIGQPEDQTDVVDAEILAADEANIDSNSAFCDVAFDFDNNGDLLEIQCRAWGCEFAVGSSRVECQSGVLCNCGEDECPALIGTFTAGIDEVTMDCDSAGCEECTDKNCVIELGTIKLESACTARECVNPTADVVLESKGSSNGFSVSDIALISLVPTALVLACAIGLGLPTLLLARRMSNPPQGVDKYTSKATESHVSEVMFLGVSCSVPVGRTIDVPVATQIKPKEEDLESSTSSELPFSRGASSQPEYLLGLNPGLVDMMMDEKKGNKSVLRGITGTFHKGEVVGVMGPSGSGKTTFLSILSNVAVDGSSQRSVQGDILVNGRLQGAWLKRIVAFVPQEDKLLGMLTVREAIMVSAILRLPDADWPTIHHRTQQVMSDLGLNAVAESLVGGVRGRRGISGGERRRVTIGMELVTDPSIIIMDEPTSGLDSFTALNLMHSLKGISMAGRIVVASLHQPAPAIMDILDTVLLLAKGFQVYLGPPGDAVRFFGQHGFPCPESLAISEYMLQVVSNPDALVRLLNSIFDASMKNRACRTVVNSKTINNPTYSSALPEAGGTGGKHKSSLRVLLWRGFVDMVRNPSLLLSHVAMGVVMGVMAGVIFWDSSLDVEGAQNRLGAFFFLLAFLAFTSLTTSDLLHSEREIAFREIKAGFYTPTTYIASKLILDAILLRMLPALLLAIPMNFMMGLQREDPKFWIYILTVVSFNLIIGGMSMIVTIWSPTPGTTSLVMNTILLMNLLFSGHLVQWDAIPVILRWIRYACPFSYAFHALVLNEFVGLRLTFTVVGYVSVDNIAGEVFLQTLGIKLGELQRNEIILAGFYLGVVVLAFVSIWLSMTFARRGSVRSLAKGWKPRNARKRSKSFAPRAEAKRKDTEIRRLPIRDQNDNGPIELNAI